MKDFRQRFLIESCDVRGQYIKLDEAWQNACSRVDYPDSVSTVLGEAFVAAGLLAATIKFEGKLTLQVRGPGNIHILVVQVTSEGNFRGLARWQAVPTGNSLLELFGEEAQLTIAIEATRGAEPYQGIVALEGESLSDAIRQYFESSEQLKTHLQFAVSKESASGILLQALPTDERLFADEDGFQRAVALAESFSSAEMLNQEVERLLHLAYHQETVRVFDVEPVAFKCSCSRERIDGMLQGMGLKEVNDILQEQKLIEVTCEFCDETYSYDRVDADALFSATPGYEASSDVPDVGH